jgi:hypothetical protein
MFHARAAKNTIYNIHFFLAHLRVCLRGCVVVRRQARRHTTRTADTKAKLPKLKIKGVDKIWNFIKGR